MTAPGCEAGRRCSHQRRHTAPKQPAGRSEPPVSAEPQGSERHWEAVCLHPRWRSAPAAAAGSGAAPGTGVAPVRPDPLPAVPTAQTWRPPRPLRRESEEWGASAPPTAPGPPLPAASTEEGPSPGEAASRGWPRCSPPAPDKDRREGDCPVQKCYPPLRSAGCVSGPLWGGGGLGVPGSCEVAATAPPPGPCAPADTAQGRTPSVHVPAADGQQPGTRSRQGHGTARQPSQAQVGEVLAHRTQQRQGRRPLLATAQPPPSRGATPYCQAAAPPQRPAELALARCRLQAEGGWKPPDVGGPTAGRRCRAWQQPPETRSQHEWGT